MVFFFMAIILSGLWGFPSPVFVVIISWILGFVKGFLTTFFEKVSWFR